jgi:hypothetical protein
MVRCSRYHLPAEAAKVQPIVIFLLFIDAPFVAATATATALVEFSLREKVKP